jgi:hypothetical protein
VVLVHTSVLIDYLRGVNNRGTDNFQFILNSDIPFGINSLIYQELLQGAKTEKEFRELKKCLETQIFYDIKDKKTSFENAALIYFSCRKKGRQIGSTIDCLMSLVH